MSAANEPDDLQPLVALAQQVHDEMTSAGLSLATAESCTGGLIGHVLTEIPGASDYYAGGLVCYSDALKRDWLGVDARTLESHGAVSAQTCVAMAVGARERYATALAVSVTGIAGPAGGSDAKPVGLTYVGISDADGHDVRRFVWDGDRHANKMRSAHAALTLIMERLDARRS